MFICSIVKKIWAYDICKPFFFCIDFTNSPNIFEIGVALILDLGIRYGPKTCSCKYVISTVCPSFCSSAINSFTLIPHTHMDTYSFAMLRLFFQEEV